MQNPYVIVTGTGHSEHWEKLSTFEQKLVKQKQKWATIQHTAALEALKSLEQFLATIPDDERVKHGFKQSLQQNRIPMWENDLQWHSEKHDDHYNEYDSDELLKKIDFYKYICDDINHSLRVAQYLKKRHNRV